MPSKSIASQNRKKKQEEISTQTGLEETRKFLETTPRVNTEFSPNVAKTMEVAGMPVREEQVSRRQTGEFSKEKGGFTSEGGKFYPTTNPDFVPSQPTLTTQIKFNKDNSIDYTPKGSSEAIKLTKEEYNVLQGEAGNVTNKVKEIQQAEQPAISNIGLTPEQIAAAQAMGTEAPINFGQAATAGAAQAVPGVIGGIVGGATIGAFGGPIGAVGGAVLGGVATFLNGVRSNIKNQQSGEIGKTTLVLSSAKTNMRNLATMASKYPERADEYVDLYNQQLTKVYQAQAKLKMETQGNLNAFLNDGSEELKQFELFLGEGGMSQIYREKLQMALLSGAPMEFSAEDLAMYGEE